MRNSNQFVSYWFDRFLDTVMGQKVAPNYHRLLSKEDLRALAEKDQWIAEHGLEEKLLLLSRLGYPFALCVGAPQRQPSRGDISKMVSIFFRCLSFKKERATKVMRDRFFFVLADTDFLRGLKLSASIFNSPAATTLAGYSGIAGKIYSYKFDVQKQMTKDAAAGQDIDGIVLNAFQVCMLPSAAAGFKNLYGISERQYMILALLSRHKLLKLDDIIRLTGGPRWIPTHTRALIDMRLIDKKHIDGVATKTHEHYWITGMGEQILLKARNYFIQHL